MSQHQLIESIKTTGVRSSVVPARIAHSGRQQPLGRSDTAEGLGGILGTVETTQAVSEYLHQQEIKEKS